MTETTKKKRKIKATPILPRIVILCFLFMILLFMNVDSLSYLMNYKSYERAQATIAKTTTDDFLMVIPKVEIQYEYQGVTYTEEKYYVIPQRFSLPYEEGSSVGVYVNTTAPNYTLFRMNFFKNVWNWLLVALIVVCIINLTRRIKKRGTQKKEKKTDKRKRKHKRKSKRKTKGKEETDYEKIIQYMD
jgi:hypothetical protein